MKFVVVGALGDMIVTIVEVVEDDGSCVDVVSATPLVFFFFFCVVVVVGRAP